MIVVFSVLLVSKMQRKMSSQVVSLAWDGHHRTLVRVFEKLLENSSFVDCILSSEGQTLKAHKQVLSAFSPYFELLFSEETEKNPTVIISGITFRDLKSLVDFMYQGKLEVTEDRIQDLIDAAECLQIKGLGGGHEEDGSENIKNTIVLHKRPTLSSRISHKKSRKAEDKEAARVFSQKSNVKSVNFSNEIPQNSDLVTSVAKQTSSVQNLMPNCVQNVPSVSNVLFMPTQSTLSEIEMDNLPLNDEPVVKIEPDRDENTKAPMTNTSSNIYICGSSGISNENSGGETILGLSADFSVPSEKNVCDDLLSDCIPPAVLSSQLSSSDLIVSSVKYEVCNINMQLLSPSMDPVEPAVETQDASLHSEFHVKTEPSTQEVDHLHTESEDFSENMAQCIGAPSVSDVQMKDCSAIKTWSPTYKMEFIYQSSAISTPYEAWQFHLYTAFIPSAFHLCTD